MGVDHGLAHSIHGQEAAPHRELQARKIKQLLLVWNVTPGTVFLDPGAAWGAGRPVDKSCIFLHHLIAVLWGMSFLWVVFLQC